MSRFQIRSSAALAALALLIGTTTIAGAQDESRPAARPAGSASEAASPEPPSLEPVVRDLDEARTALDEQQQQLREHVRSLAERIETESPRSPAADAVDREVAEALAAARQSTLDAIRALTAPSLVPADGEPADERDRASAAEAELRWRRVEIAATAMERLVELRKLSATRISDVRRRELLGFSRSGFRQLEREVAQVRATLALYLARRSHSIDEVPRLARDVFTLSSALFHLVTLLLVISATLWARRRWRVWLAELRSTGFRSLGSMRWKRRLQRLLDAVEVIAPWGLFLATLAMLQWGLGPAGDTVEATILLTVAAIWGSYRLAVDVAASILLGIAVHYGLDVSDSRRAMLLKSIRHVLRISAALLLILLVSRGAGQGYLGSLVVKFAWVVILAALVAELLRWRHDMVDTLLRLQPDGRLAAAVRQSRDRWYGVLVAPAGFVWLAGRAGATVAREFALGFEQTQKALAYVFRRQVERRAEVQGYAEGAVGELPEGVVAAFQEQAVDRGPLVVEHFPRLRELHEVLSTWRDTGAAGSFLVTGERGIGKTSWLNQIQREDLRIERLEPGGRTTDFGELARRLGDPLQVEVDPDDPLSSLAEGLIEGPRRVVVLDMAQHLFLAAVGGYDAFAGFARLVNRTCRHVFWLCSMNTYAWRHLTAVRPDAAVFRGSVSLSPWNEERIRELIRTRCEASGARFNFADLVIDGIEGVSTRARLIESEEGYTRLLWDYADGNPRAALHYFLRSLDPERGNRVRVRLFRAPEVGRLEAGGFDGLFVLAAVVTHESIGFDHLVDVTRMQRPECFIHVDRLVELGAIECIDEMYRVTTTWHRAAVRLLRRRNLLPV